MYQPSIILAEGVWQIDINLPLQHTETEAKYSATVGCGCIKFVKDLKGVPAIEVVSREIPLMFYDNDIVITEISERKLASMGKPLDMSNHEEVKLACSVLETLDPAYCVNQEDMAPSDKTLRWFLDKYGIDYQPDWIAYGVQNVKQRTPSKYIGAVSH